MNIYCISGLGADKRAFKKLSIQGYNLIHIEWISVTKNESITSYSKRLSKQINTDEPYLLLGLSFGGVIASEIAQFLDPEKVILISSITNKRNLPFGFRLIGRIRIVNIIPANWLRPPMILAYWFFGVKQQKNKQLLKEIFKDTDQDFLKWSILKLLNKKQIPQTDSPIKIHGSNDRLLPLISDSNVLKIENAGHFMVMEHADEVNQALYKSLK